MEEITTKVCIECKEVKSISEFSKTDKSSSSIRNKCKKCYSIYQKNYRTNNKNILKIKQTLYNKINIEKIKKNKQRYYLENKISIKQYRSRYYKKNYEKIYDRNSKYKQKRLKTNPIIKFIENVRHRISVGIKNNKNSIKKQHNSIDLLCCDWKFAHNHLENQFVGNMSWENHGKVWHIDHIIPISFFDLTDLTEQKLAFHWGNLQPLFIKENLEKNDNILDVNFNY